MTSLSALARLRSVQWRDNDKILLDALPEHYNQAAHIKSGT